MITFDLLRQTLVARQMSKGDLQKHTTFSFTSIAKLSKSNIMPDVVDRIAIVFDTLIYYEVEVIRESASYNLECVSKCREMQFRGDLSAFQGDFPQA